MATSEMPNAVAMRIGRSRKRTSGKLWQGEALWQDTDGRDAMRRQIEE